jgi:hypothetical protein
VNRFNYRPATDHFFRPRPVPQVEAEPQGPREHLPLAGIVAAGLFYLIVVNVWVFLP